MKISVITPVFNDPRVARALDSILSQRHEHELELIVVDAGSTDDTMEILEGYRDSVTTLISEPDDGIYDGMNKGIRLATGDVVGILNADDRYSDEFVLRDVLETFSDSETDACYGNLVYVNDDDEIVRYWKSGGHSAGKWYWGWMPPHPTFFVRRNMYEQYGVFDLGFPIAADYELMLRLLFKKRVRVKYLDRVLVRMASRRRVERLHIEYIQGESGSRPRLAPQRPERRASGPVPQTGEQGLSIHFPSYWNSASLRFAATVHNR